MHPTSSGTGSFASGFSPSPSWQPPSTTRNVVPIYEAGEADGFLFIAMRYVDGSDLKRLLGDGPLAAVEAIRIAAQIASALDAAHTRGLVHRDVKPSNVLVDSAGHAYLGDFGLTKRLPGPCVLSAWRPSALRRSDT